MLPLSKRLAILVPRNGLEPDATPRKNGARSRPDFNWGRDILTEGLQVATTEMARWLEDSYRLNASEVASVLGTAMRYDIAEVVDPYVNVVARVSKKALAPIEKPGP
jgi:hypothetical protein